MYLLQDSGVFFRAPAPYGSIAHSLVLASHAAKADEAVSLRAETHIGVARILMLAIRRAALVGRGVPMASPHDSRVCRRVCSDWMAKYGHPIHLSTPSAGPRR